MRACKEYRARKIDEVQLLPPSVQDWVTADHLSRLVVSLVRESLDLSASIGSHASGLGQPALRSRSAWNAVWKASAGVARACTPFQRWTVVVAQYCAIITEIVLPGVV